MGIGLVILVSSLTNDVFGRSLDEPVDGASEHLSFGLEFVSSTFERQTLRCRLKRL